MPIFAILLPLTIVAELCCVLVVQSCKKRPQAEQDAESHPNSVWMDAPKTPQSQIQYAQHVAAVSYQLSPPPSPLDGHPSSPAAFYNNKNNNSGLMYAQHPPTPPRGHYVPSQEHHIIKTDASSPHRQQQQHNQWFPLLHHHR